MTAFLRLVFALSFELKAGRIKSDDLRSRMNRVIVAMAMQDGEDASDLAKAGQRYAGIDLSDSMVSNELLIDVLIKGIIDETEIRSSIDKSRYFITAADEPAWRAVWHWLERTDNEFAATYDKMEQQFTARQFTIFGELLHVLGLRLFLSDRGILGKTRGEVISEGKKYIDDLYDEQRLEGPPNDFSEVHFGGFSGLGIFENKTAEFRELFAYLKQKEEQAVKDTYPENGLTLLKALECDPQVYVRRLCLTNSEDNLYYRVPILAAMDPDAFVASLLNQHPARQSIIMMAFKLRYEHGGIESELAAEKQWLMAVRDKLVEKAATMPPIEKYRLLNNIERNTTPALREVQGGNLPN